jgi:hypothetical protein
VLRVPVAAAAAVCLGLVSASAAAAATVTIGPPDVSSTQALNQCPDTTCTRTLAQLTQPTVGVLLTAPADGVITAWHVHGNTAFGVDGLLALRVLRRDPDGIRFMGVATSAGVTADFNDGSPAHAVSIPVQAGDYIGVNMSRVGTLSGAPVFVYTSQPAGATYGVWEGGLPDGSTLATTSTVAERLMLNAVETLRPAVSGVSPSSGSTAGGEVVTITGSNLDGATGVSFGGTPAASFSAVSATQVAATAPARAQGTVDVRVTEPGGQSSVTPADVYSYVTPGVTPPSIAIAIASPANGATYAQGQAVTAAYSCTAPEGTTVTTCAGPVANGALIDTSTLGSHAFTVNAQDSDDGPATKSAGYTVVAAPTPIVSVVAALTPIVSGASETTKAWRESNALPHIARRKLPFATTFSFALNEAATVTFSFAQHPTGRRVRRKCVEPTQRNRNKPRCARAIPAGSLTFSGHPGSNRVRFAGRISRTNKLKPGSYTLQITASTQGRRSAPQSLSFTIVK